MCLQHRQLDRQLGWMGSDDEVAINAMKCASVSLVYSLLSVHCAVAGNVAEAASANNNPFVDIVRRTRGVGGLAGSSGLSAARQRVPWPLL